MNLLLDNSDWVLTQADHNGSQYNIEINATYGSYPNGKLEWGINTIDPGDVVAGTITWEVTTPPDNGELYFLVIDDGVVVHEHRLYQEFVISSGTHTFSVPVTSNPRLVTSGINYDEFPGPAGYSQLGMIGLVATADVEPEPEPETNLPWWYCTPKEPVPECPVRDTAFVPFDEYDTDFKYPLASSRVPSPVPTNGECNSCSPTLIVCDPDGGTDPDPDPDTGDCASMHLTVNGDSLVEESLTDFPDWFSYGDTDFLLRVSGETYEFDYNGSQYTTEGSVNSPFDNIDAILTGEICEVTEGTQVWSCILITGHLAE